MEHSILEIYNYSKIDSVSVFNYGNNKTKHFRENYADSYSINKRKIGNKTPVFIGIWRIKKEKPLYDETESSKRMSVIAQNGNTGEHYKESKWDFLDKITILSKTANPKRYK